MLARISVEERDIILTHNQKLIESATNALNGYRDIKNPDAKQYVAKQTLYWRHVIGALKWSNSLAIQLSGVK